VDLDGGDDDAGQGVTLGGVAGAVVGPGLGAAELDGQLRLQPILEEVRGQRVGQQADGDDRRDDRETRQQPAGDGPRPERLEEEPGPVMEPVGLLGGQRGVCQSSAPQRSGDGSGAGTVTRPDPGNRCYKVVILMPGDASGEAGEPPLAPGLAAAPQVGPDPEAHAEESGDRG